ncbi:MAG TPA: class I SAM-dependent methyltransferase [Vicinamibacterales bacterium]|nr:class I SAM-dependent methyltransferase [Vicinamibacterales bacterium]
MDDLAGWLALREAVDHASRSASLVEEAAAALPASRPLRVVDLGSGTGSNVRYLAPRLPAPQRWLLVDREPALLARMNRSDLVLETRTADLGRFDAGLVAGAHLVTASALLDLVSEPWLRALARACRDQNAVALFALTYNGRSSCSPPEPEDDRVLYLFNSHQRQNDKGFGTAAGPDAVERASEAFEACSYQVRRHPSDWNLPPAAAALQTQLIDGWAEAAAEVAPEDGGMLADWRTRRIAHVRAGVSRIVVCHEDLVAIAV